MLHTFALFAPPNLIDNLLLKFFSPETVNYVVWPFIQIGAVVTAVAVYALAYSLSLGVSLVEYFSGDKLG